MLATPSSRTSRLGDQPRSRPCATSTTGAPASEAELQDIKDNRATYTIDSHTLGTPKVSIDFGGVCDFRARPADACISLSCEWHSTRKRPATRASPRGTCHLTSVYRDARWQLCNSEFEGMTSFRTAFMR